MKFSRRRSVSWPPRLDVEADVVAGTSKTTDRPFESPASIVRVRERVLFRQKQIGPMMQSPVAALKQHSGGSYQHEFANRTP